MSMVAAMKFFRSCSFIGDGFSLRSLSSISTAVPPPSAEASVTESKPKRKKKKNLFEVAHFLPNWGIGYQMAKNHWHGTSYKITKINLYKDGKHGKAWGVFHRDGVPDTEEPKKISGVHKRGWRYIPESRKKCQALPEPERPHLGTV